MKWEFDPPILHQKFCPFSIMVLHLFCNQVTAVRFCHGAPIYLSSVNGSTTVSKTVSRGSNPCWDAKFMEVWQSLVYCTCLENRRVEMLREFESHRFRQSTKGLLCLEKIR